MIGSALFHYRITGELGSGGMGEVWRAEDTKLGRDVALKVLPERVAEDHDRLARFEREARVLASLNHPNIAHLYGLESVASDADPNAGATTFLVMELVEGEDLSDRIAQGPIPVAEAVAIARQIAEALEAAHEQGVVHRDLKPANIKIATDGTVKVLDFGLAKAWEAEDAEASLSLSPTLTQHATAAGVILGTAAYMSPEQARGLAVDRRSDIWAFGVVLWEMLTGRKLFEGETVSDVLASVLKEAPELDALPRTTPTALRKLIARCLDKDPSTRLRDIGEARVALNRPEATRETAGTDEPAPRRRQMLPWLLTGTAVVAAAVLAVMLIGRAEPDARVFRFGVSPPPDGRFHLAPDNPGPVAVSPDGTMLAYSGRTSDGVVQLWVRALDEAQARALPGTENAQYPFWSPDSRRIGFFARNKLRVIDAAGGPPQALCDAPDGKGGSWSSEGGIAFAPSYNSPIHRVAEAGGESVAVTEFDTERRDNSHRHPRFLPDGRHFLYMARSGAGSAEGQAVVLGSVDGAVDRLLFRAPTAVEYASGHLLFIREQTLMARPFDASRLELTGEPFPIAESVAMLPAGTVIGIFSASQNGVLVFLEGVGGDGAYRLVWRDREGTEVGTVGEPGSIDEVHLVPGDELAVVAMEESGTGNGDLWIVDLRRELFSRFTFEPGFESGIAPTPDGRALIYTREQSGVWSFVRKQIGGTGEGEVIYTSEIDMYPTSVSPDGGTLVFFRGGDNTNYDIWTMPLAGEGEAAPLIQTDFDEFSGMVSPDGRWLAYGSNESGRPEIYITAFPDRGRKWQASTSGGVTCRWNNDGSELLFHAPDGGLMSVRVEERAGGLLIGEPAPIFNTMVQPFGAMFWALSADDQRLLVMESTASQDTPDLSVVINWPEATRRP